MQCPNCKMNISDSSRICLHCGLQFNQIQSSSGVCPNCKASVNPTDQFCISCGTNLASASASVSTSQVAQQTPQQQVGVPFVKQNNAINKEPYLRAYFGKSYDHDMTSHFSIGTFFLEWFWLAFYRLYGDAFSMVLTQIGVGIALFVVLLVLNLIGINLSSISSGLSFAASIYISIIYAKKFPESYYKRADKKISEILEKTTDENERLKLCKKAGKPNFLVPIIIFLAPLIIVPLLVLPATMNTIDKTRINVFADEAQTYINEVRTLVLFDKLDCGGVISALPSGMYYYSFTTANGDSSVVFEQPAKSPWQDKNISGQVYIYKRSSPYSQKGVYDYAIVLVDEDGRGIGEFDSNGKPMLVINSNNIMSSSVSVKDGNNRKLYYNISKDGTDEALNVLTAPTLETKWNDMSFSQMMTYDGISPINPIACKMNSN